MLSIRKNILAFPPGVEVSIERLRFFGSLLEDGEAIEFGNKKIEVYNAKDEIWWFILAHKR